MAQSNRKKDKQNRKAAQKQKKEQHYRAIKAERKLYPRLVIDPTGGDPELIRNVRRVIDDIDFAAPDQFDESNREILKVLGAVGIRDLPQVVAEVGERLGQPFSNEELRDDLFHLLYCIGDGIFDRLPDPFRATPLPRFFFRVVPTGKNIAIQFVFTPIVSDGPNPIYCPTDEPLVEYGPTRWQFGFSRHAVEQLCKRIRQNETMTYRDFTRCHAYFICCRYFESVELAEGHPALRLYYPCDSEGTTAHSVYVKQILGSENLQDGAGDACYVLGYCPIEIIKGRAVATTFLYPGYKGTPEDVLLRAAALPYPKRRELLQAADHNVAYRVLHEGNVDVIKWYHDNGIPQVKQITGPLFAELEYF
jgi:hypothetical protein